MPVSPVRISVYDSEGAPQDWVGAPLSVAVHPRAAGASDATLVLDHDDEQVPVLMAEGARCAVDLLVDPVGQVWSSLAVGEVAERSGASDAAMTRTFTVADARMLVMGLLVHPAPASAPAPGVMTTVGGASREVTGPAETVLKTLVAENAAWQGMDVRVAPDQGRGSTVTASSRFGALAELWPDLAAAGVLPVVDVDGPGWSLDVVTTTTVPGVLTQASGIVQPGSWKALPPTLTRCVVLGAGEGPDREALLLVDTEAEARWSPRVGTRDARDVGDAADPYQVMLARGMAELAAGAESAQVSAELSQTEEWRYGVSFGLGDTVTVRLDGAPDITAMVSEVTVTWDTSGGLLVVPHVGDVDTSFDAVVATALASLDRRLDRSGRQT